MTNDTFVRFQLQPNGLNYYCNHVCLTYFCLHFIQILLCIEMKIATFEWWSKNQLNWTLERIRFRREIRILNDFLFWMCSFVPIFSVKAIHFLGTHSGYLPESYVSTAKGGLWILLEIDFLSQLAVCILWWHYTIFISCQCFFLKKRV